MDPFFAQAAEPVPSLLFRVHSEESPGSNTEAYFESEARYLKQDVSAMSKDDRRMMLVEHTVIPRWKKGEERPVPDDYISFTPSLVWAMQYAYYKCNRHPDFPVYLTVVKTIDFEPGTFQHTLSLFRAYQLPQRGPKDKQTLLDDQYNCSEWLTTGCLDIKGRSCTISMYDLENAGLSNVFPEFRDAEAIAFLHKRVVALRRMWCELEGTDRPATHLDRTNCFPLSEEDLAIFSRLARVFTEQYRWQMFIWLLAMKNRGEMPAILTKIMDHASGMHFSSVFNVLEVGTNHVSDWPRLSGAAASRFLLGRWPKELTDLDRFENLELALNDLARKHKADQYRAVNRRAHDGPADKIGAGEDVGVLVGQLDELRV